MSEKLWGWMFIVLGIVSFLGFIMVSIVLKLLPPFSDSHGFLSSIQNDRYYCFLIPLTVPVVMVAVYFHWLNMKFFKHA